MSPEEKEMRKVLRGILTEYLANQQDTPLHFWQIVKLGRAIQAHESSLRKLREICEDFDDNLMRDWKS